MLYSLTIVGPVCSQQPYIIPSHAALLQPRYPMYFTTVTLSPDPMNEDISQIALSGSFGLTPHHLQPHQGCALQRKRSNFYQLVFSELDSKGCRASLAFITFDVTQVFISLILTVMRRLLCALPLPSQLCVLSTVSIETLMPWGLCVFINPSIQITNFRILPYKGKFYNEQ